MKKPSGFVLITLATAIGGIAGYVIMWIVPRQIGFASYVGFAIFWSYLFLVVSALSGIQQEITRATQPSDHADGVRASRARNFGLVSAAVVFVLIISTAPMWVGQVFPEDGWTLVWPLAVGAASYIAVAVLYGSLYGIMQWVPLFWLISIDALMRLAAVGIATLFTAQMAVLAWAVVVPFPLTLVLLWPFTRSRVVGRVQLDVGYRNLTWNVARTVVAAAAMGLLVSGFPLLLGLTSFGESQDLVGLLILAATLTRAPLIVVAVAFQSYLIVLFRERAASWWRLLLGLEALIAGVALILAVIGWWLGPAIFAALYPGELVPENWLIAVLILSSALVGSLFVTATAVLSKAVHSIYTAGWGAAAVVTVVCLLLPLDFISRTVLSLLAGPAAGLVVHVGYFVVDAWRAGNQVEEPGADALSPER